MAAQETQLKEVFINHIQNFGVFLHIEFSSKKTFAGRNPFKMSGCQDIRVTFIPLYFIPQNISQVFIDSIIFVFRVHQNRLKVGLARVVGFFQELDKNSSVF